MKREKIYFLLQNIEVWNDSEDLFQYHETENELKQNFDEIDPELYERLERIYYRPSDSMELFDFETQTFYSNDGTEFRDPEEFDPYQEGYTPFGDE